MKALVCQSRLKAKDERRKTKDKERLAFSFCAFHLESCVCSVNISLKGRGVWGIIFCSEDFKKY